MRARSPTRPDEDLIESCNKSSWISTLIDIRLNLFSDTGGPVKVPPISKRLGKTKWGLLPHLSGKENAFLSMSIALQDMVSHFCPLSEPKGLCLSQICSSHRERSMIHCYHFRNNTLVLYSTIYSIAKQMVPRSFLPDGQVTARQLRKSAMQLPMHSGRVYGFDKVLM